MSYTHTAAPDGIVVDITFTSNESKTYIIYHSNDSITPVENRPDVENSLPSSLAGPDR